MPCTVVVQRKHDPPTARFLGDSYLNLLADDKTRANEGWRRPSWYSLKSSSVSSSCSTMTEHFLLLPVAPLSAGRDGDMVPVAGDVPALYCVDQAEDVRDLS